MLKLSEERDETTERLPSYHSHSNLILEHNSNSMSESSNTYDSLDSLRQDSYSKPSNLLIIDNLSDFEENIESSINSIQISESTSSVGDSFKEKDRSNHVRENFVNNKVNNKPDAVFTFNKNCKVNSMSYCIPLNHLDCTPSPPMQSNPAPSIPIPSLPSLSIPSPPSLPTKENDNSISKRGRGRPKKPEGKKKKISTPSSSSSSSLSSCNSSSSSSQCGNINVKRGKGRPRRTVDYNISIPQPPPPLLHYNGRCGIDLSEEIKEWFNDVCSKKCEKKNLPIPNDVINEFKKIKDEKVKCCNCENKILKLNCFKFNNDSNCDRSKYICCDCAIKNVKKEESKCLQHWENEVKNGKGLRCQRLNHWYPLHDYVEVRSCDEEGRALRGESYKPEQQCIFCRNFKKYEYGANRLLKLRI